MKDLVSVIIPCFNTGVFLLEAIDSVLCNHFENYEIIVVNDGSTDPNTLQLLIDLRSKDVTVIDQANRGPNAARNTGVNASKGDYLLFLDSDNKIRPDYLQNALKVFISYPRVGVVYGNVSFFGESSKPRFTVQPHDKYSILLSNYIDMCSLIRRKVWDELNGLDESRVLIGGEDWDFWIRATEKEWEFYFINEVMFDYRIRSNSLSESCAGDADMLNYIRNKHLKLTLYYYEQLYKKVSFYEKEHKNPFRLFAKYLYHKYLKNIGPR